MSKNFLKTIASAFVEVQQDENVVNNMGEQHVTTGQTKPIVQQTKVLNQVLSNTATNDGSIRGQLDNQLFEQLCDVIEESNLPGPDYVELTKVAQNDTMKAAIPDENSRLAAAYITMKATSPQLNRNVVLGSIDTYIGILETERKNGLDQLQEKWVENVEKPQNEVNAAQEEVIELQNKLQEKIRFIAEQKSAIADAQNEYNINKANFNYTFDVFIKKLNDDKVKLDAILQD